MVLPPDRVSQSTADRATGQEQEGVPDAGEGDHQRGQQAAGDDAGSKADHGVVAGSLQHVVLGLPWVTVPTGRG